jgi:arginase
VAVKIVRQPNKIALLGAPTSAAGLALGHEQAPAKLRQAGLIEGLRAAGYDVTDMGDDPPQLYQPDEQSPRARNLPRILKALEALKPRVEQAIKSGALPLILGGDCSIALATIAALHRYHRNVSAVYMDSDADLNTPATTHSGCVDGMVVAHLTGRGAAELVRFWGEPPLVREPDIALFGVDRLDPPEEELLRRTPIQRYLAADIRRLGPAATAQTAVERIHGTGNEFLLHFDVDVISSEDFGATNLPGSGGLRLDDVRQALEVFARQKRMAAFEVTAYNPERDADGSGAKIVVDLVVSVLAARLQTLAAVTTSADASAAPASAQAPQLAEPAPSQIPFTEAPRSEPAPVSGEPASGQAEASLAATAAPVPLEVSPAATQTPTGPDSESSAATVVAPAPESVAAPAENLQEPSEPEKN